jgi:hypothetical protein
MLVDMAAAQLGRPRARVLTASVQDHPYDRPALTTGGWYLVRGTAGDDAGRAESSARLPRNRSG